MTHIRSDETVASALSASAVGLPDTMNAEQHGVALKTIRRWRREYVRDGRDRGQRHLRAQCPRCESGPLDGGAYAELFGWYLGDGYLSTQRRGVFGLHIYNDSKYVALNQNLKNLMLEVKPESRPHTRLLRGCTVTTVSWKHWPCLFPQHGPGRKHERTLGMEPWQWDVVETYPAAFLRGLFHSDGCLARNTVHRMVDGVRREHTYPRWQFRNASEEIMRWCGDALDLVEVAWQRSGPRTLSVSRRDDVARLTHLIGEKA